RAACISSFETLKKNEDDIPFAALYLADEKQFVLMEECVIGDSPLNIFPDRILLNSEITDTPAAWPIAEVMKTKASRRVTLAKDNTMRTARMGQPVSEAIVLPVISSGQTAPIGVLIAGVNPCRKLDPDYITFYD